MVHGQDILLILRIKQRLLHILLQTKQLLDKVPTRVATLLCAGLLYRQPAIALLSAPFRRATDSSLRDADSHVISTPRYPVVIVNWVHYLGPPGPFSFPGDLLEVLGDFLGRERGGGP